MGATGTPGSFTHCRADVAPIPSLRRTWTNVPEPGNMATTRLAGWHPGVGRLPCLPSSGRGERR
jgi:hypothetical protein